MKKGNLQIKEAKTHIIQLFTDKYYRPKKTPHYTAKIQLLLETKDIPHKTTYQALKQLESEGKLSKLTKTTKYANTISFYYNPKLDKPQYKRMLNLHANSVCQLIDQYSNPKITKRYGAHLENLVALELQKQGFKILARNTKKYNDKEYPKSDNTLDIIAQHASGNFTIGIEIKNTLSLLDKKEVKTKLDMCRFFGITPVFAVRWIGSYKKLIEDQGGFCWIFKEQLYPTDYSAFTGKLKNRLILPVQAKSTLPIESVRSFQSWVDEKNNPFCMALKKMVLSTVT